MFAFNGLSTSHALLNMVLKKSATWALSSCVALKIISSSPAALGRNAGFQKILWPKDAEPRGWSRKWKPPNF
jgi:hypothetical protein